MNAKPNKIDSNKKKNNKINLNSNTGIEGGRDRNRLMVWKDTNHAVFDLLRASGAGAEPGSLHSLVSLVFPHFLEEHQMKKRRGKAKKIKGKNRNPDGKRRKIRENV